MEVHGTKEDTAAEESFSDWERKKKLPGDLRWLHDAAEWRPVVQMAMLASKEGSNQKMMNVMMVTEIG